MATTEIDSKMIQVGGRAWRGREVLLMDSTNNRTREHYLGSRALVVVSLVEPLSRGNTWSGRDLYRRVGDKFPIHHTSKTQPNEPLNSVSLRRSFCLDCFTYHIFLFFNSTSVTRETTNTMIMWITHTLVCVDSHAVI